MENIDNWMEEFKFNWENKNVDKVLQLFNKNLVYYENPFMKLEKIKDIRSQWETIYKQKNIQLSYEIFSGYKNRHSIIWDLKYQNQQNHSRHLRGTYLIELDENNLCTYFYHTGESQ